MTAFIHNEIADRKTASMQQSNKLDNDSLQEQQDSKSDDGIQPSTAKREVES